MSDLYGIVANAIEPDKCLRGNTRCWLADGSSGCGYEKFIWIGLSRGGRKIRKWAPTHRFSNFRAAWIPEHVRLDILYISGSRESMDKVAADLNKHAILYRQAHPFRRVAVTKPSFPA